MSGSNYSAIRHERNIHSTAHDRLNRIIRHNVACHMTKIRQNRYNRSDQPWWSGFNNNSTVWFWHEIDLSGGREPA